MHTESLFYNTTDDNFLCTPAPCALQDTDYNICVIYLPALQAMTTWEYQEGVGKRYELFGLRNRSY